jgi:nitrite reductase/ring-hydroxylating ferredoxin subunit
MAVTKASFLKTTYGGYFHSSMPKEDEGLTHYGPGTPCGEYLRRFWHPVAFTNDLKDLPCAIKIMGEELVVFRNKAGQVGCLELHCSHRGTSLEFGLIEDQGIRCCYHGWLFGVNGRILDTPGEPPDSTYKERLCHGAYPVHEAMGMVFVYMGPPDKRTPFPNLDTFNVPGYRLVPFTRDILPCNWMQMQDNAMDPVHTTFLHTRSSGTQFTDSFAEMPQMDWVETPIGMLYIATRRIGDNVWTRMGEFICPNIGQFPHNEEFGTDEHPFIPPHNTKWRVPIDDTSSLEMSLRRIADDEEAPVPREVGHQAGREYEVRQRKPNDYEAQVSQRPIAIHALEHLGSTDRGITMFRRMVKDGIRAVQKGQDPKGIFRSEGEVVLTYGNDTVKRINSAPTLEQDAKLLRETGWKRAKQYIMEHPSLTGDVAYKV